MSTDLLSFEHPSVLLFCLAKTTVVRFYVYLSITPVLLHLCLEIKSAIVSFAVCIFREFNEVPNSAKIKHTRENVPIYGLSTVFKKSHFLIYYNRMTSHLI